MLRGGANSPQDAVDTGPPGRGDQSYYLPMLPPKRTDYFAELRPRVLAFAGGHGSDVSSA